jgi:hypothetical protein
MLYRFVVPSIYKKISIYCGSVRCRLEEFLRHAPRPVYLGRFGKLHVSIALRYWRKWGLARGGKSSIRVMFALEENVRFGYTGF